MISKDMEWMLAFSKGVQRFYLLNERRAETLETAESRMLESRPDLVILAVQDGLPSINCAPSCGKKYNRRYRSSLLTANRKGWTNGSSRALNTLAPAAIY